MRSNRYEQAISAIPTTEPKTPLLSRRGLLRKSPYIAGSLVLLTSGTKCIGAIRDSFAIQNEAWRRYPPLSGETRNEVTVFKSRTTEKAQDAIRQGKKEVTVPFGDLPRLGHGLDLPQQIQARSDFIQEEMKTRKVELRSGQGFVFGATGIGIAILGWLHRNTK